VKNRGGVGEIPIPIFEASPITEPLKYVHLMAVPCVAAEHGGLIKKKENSSWVKLKAFPTNVERSN